MQIIDEYVHLIECCCEQSLNLNQRTVGSITIGFPHHPEQQ